MSTETQWHNPENVPAEKIPKGWRFLTKSEASETCERPECKCLLWMRDDFDKRPHQRDCWSFPDPLNTYIVPIEQDDDVSVFPDIKEDPAFRTSDPINPDHYTSGPIQCIDAIQAALSPEQFIGFCRGNSFKYTWRADKKGDAVENLKKSIWYQEREIAARQEATL